MRMVNHSEKAELGNAIILAKNESRDGGKMNIWHVCFAGSTGGGFGQPRCEPRAVVSNQANVLTAAIHIRLEEDVVVTSLLFAGTMEGGRQFREQRHAFTFNLKKMYSLQVFLAPVQRTVADSFVSSGTHISWVYQFNGSPQP